MKRLKILYLGNFANPVAEYISKTFEQLGHEITRRNEDDTSVEDVIRIIENTKYDFVLTEEARLKGDYHYGEIKNNELDRCDGGFKGVMDRILVVPWLTNVIWAIERRKHLVSENPIFHSPVVFSTDGGRDAEWKSAGVNHVCVRQGVFQDHAFLGGRFLTRARVGFVGENNQRFWSYRQELLSFLQNTYGSDFEWVGPGSSWGFCYGKDLNNFLATVKIVVGDSVMSDYYWSNRVYEVIGRGGFLIMPDIKGLDEEFTPYKHYVPYEFGNFKDLETKIKFYLKNRNERETIRQQGFEYCKENHTYAKRVEQIIAILNQNGLLI